MDNLNKRIEDLEKQIKALQSKIEDLSRNTEEKIRKPYTIAGGGRDRSQIRPIDISTGMGQLFGGSAVWNNTEADIPPYNAEPDTPTIGYNKHSHSRFSGGALIIDVLEFVQYVWGTITNKHSQQYWNPQPDIATEKNSNGERVNKIGKLNLVFNPDGGYDSKGKPIGTWGSPSYEIDVKKCYFVERVTEIDADNPTIGEIKKDSKKQEMKSYLYNEDTTKTAIKWDEDSQVWRFFAVYAPGE